jgi:hypothetical protein
MSSLALSRKPLLIAALLALCTGFPAAQEVKKDRQPDRLLRLLPLGEAPPFKFDFVDGARVEREPPAGSIPPRQVQIADAEGKEVGQPIRLVLDQLSASIPVPAGRIPLHESGRGGFDATTWHAVTMPEKSSHALALLWRDPVEKNWSKARSVILADDVASFPAGMVRLVNVSPWPVSIEFEGAKFKLEAGKLAMQGKARAVYRQVPMGIEMQDSRGRAVPVFNQGINQAAGERTNVLIYRADGNQPRRPAKVKILRERAVLPAPPKPKEAEDN